MERERNDTGMKTVTLAKPLLDGKVTSFTFREPKLADYMLFGDPRAPIVDGERVYMRPIPETVKLYADRLLTDGGDPAVMEHASLKDALAIQRAIVGFFTDAESSGPEKTTTSSSSDAGSPS